MWNVIYGEMMEYCGWGISDSKKKPENRDKE